MSNSTIEITGCVLLDILPLTTSSTLRPSNSAPSDMLRTKERIMHKSSNQSTNPFHFKTWNGGHPDESEEEAQLRLKQLHDAQKISKQIDSSLGEARKAMEKRKKGVKILLLGTNRGLVVGASLTPLASSHRSGRVWQGRPYPFLPIQNPSMTIPFYHQSSVLKSGCRKFCCV